VVANVVADVLDDAMVGMAQSTDAAVHASQESSSGQPPQDQSGAASAEQVGCSNSCEMFVSGGGGDVMITIFLQFLPSFCKKIGVFSQKPMLS
jgi:hypothetical protein